MSEVKVYYRACNERGEEELEGCIVGNKMAAKTNEWRDSLDDLSCSLCDSNTEYGIGIYLIELQGKRIKSQSYYCYDCCEDRNLFEEYSDYERFNYKLDIGL